MACATRIVDLRSGSFLFQSWSRNVLVSGQRQGCEGLAPHRRYLRVLGGLMLRNLGLAEASAVHYSRDEGITEHSPDFPCSSSPLSYFPRLDSGITRRCGGAWPSHRQPAILPPASGDRPDACGSLPSSRPQFFDAFGEASNVIETTPRPYPIRGEGWGRVSVCLVPVDDPRCLTSTALQDASLPPSSSFRSRNRSTPFWDPQTLFLSLHMLKALVLKDQDPA